MLITTTEAAELSAIPVRTVQRWAAEGRITSEARSGKIYVDGAQVQKVAEYRRNGRAPNWPRLTRQRSVAHAALSVPDPSVRDGS